MDYAHKDAPIAEKTEFNAEQNWFAPLTEMQLALVGGGVGEVIFN